MVLLRRVLPFLALTPFVYFACTAKLDMNSDNGLVDASSPDVARDHYFNSLGAGGASTALPSVLDPLCGVPAAGCTPDDPSARACASPDGGAGAGGGAGSPNAGGAAASSGGSAGADGGFKLPEVDAGRSANGVACQVTRNGTKPSAACMAAGTQASGDACADASDCQPGLACVSDGNVGRCLQYCCGGNDSCPGSTYCSTRPLKEDTAGDQDPLVVPVCVPADNCLLTEPYPCTGTDCTCPTGTACTVVRSNGTTTWTSCETPGPGVEGADCSNAACAHGFICSKASNTCLKLCTVNANMNECGAGRCQSAADLPSNWGVCVGDADGG